MGLSQKNFARPSGRPECGGESGNAPVTLSSRGLLVWGLRSAPTRLANVGKSRLIRHQRQKMKVFWSLGEPLDVKNGSAAVTLVGMDPSMMDVRARKDFTKRGTSVERGTSKGELPSKGNCDVTSAGSQQQVATETTVQYDTIDRLYSTKCRCRAGRRLNLPGNKQRASNLPFTCTSVVVSVVEPRRLLPINRRNAQ